MKPQCVLGRVRVVWGFVVEIFCLLFYTFRLVVYSKMIGSARFMKEPWSVARVVILTVTFILLASSMSGRPSLAEDSQMHSRRVCAGEGLQS